MSLPINCYEFTAISEKDIAEAIKNLSATQSSSSNGITSFMIKSAKTELLPILKNIFNMSTNTKRFPSMWKESSVTPRFKSRKDDVAGNHRTISVYVLCENFSNDASIHNVINT